MNKEYVFIQDSLSGHLLESILYLLVKIGNYQLWE